MPDLRAISTRARRFLLRYRRMLSALLAAVAVLVVVQTLAPQTPAQQAVVVATHDLTSGVTLGAADVTVEHMPPVAVPSGAASSVAEVAGRTVAGPMRAGEAVTDRRLLGRALLAGYPPRLVVAAVRIHDADVVGLLQVGDRISIYAAGRASYADLVVDRVPVVTLPASDANSQEGGLVVVAVTPDQAAHLAQANATAPLSLTLTR